MGVKQIAVAAEERQKKLELLLEANFEEISDAEHAAVEWLRDNAVSLLADYVNFAGLVLDAYPLVAGLEKVSSRDAIFSKEAKEITEKCQMWISRLD